MMEKERYKSLLSRLVPEPLPPYSPTDRNTRDPFPFDEKKEGFTARVVHTWTFASTATRSTATRLRPGISASAQSTSHFCKHQAWPAIKKFRVPKRQIYAFLLLLILGILPFFGYGFAKFRWDRLFITTFSRKTINCGNAFGQPQNSTVEGIEAMFVLDASFGRFTFSQVKIIDAAWDIIFGRAVQASAWFVSYLVFSDALLRLIDRHPVTFEIFMRIGLEGPGLYTAWSLIKELFKRQSKQTWALFCYMLLSTAYVISIPIFLSAMTGYDSRTIAWVGLGESGNIVPASYLEETYVVIGINGSTVESPSCGARESLELWSHIRYEKYSYCDNCQFPNGTVTSYQSTLYRSSLEGCVFNYTENTETYKSPARNDSTEKCNENYQIKLDNKLYYTWELTTRLGYCWENNGYVRDSLSLSKRCLPDTANPSYSWGFSTMLLAIFLIVHFIWSITMYIVWQDAQINSKLVKSGFRITELRSAFALTEVTKRRTGLEGEELFRVDVRELEEEVFGARGRPGAEVGREIFGEGAGVRKRIGRAEMIDI